MNPLARDTLRRWSIRILGFAGVTALTGIAHAMPNFPTEIQSHLGLAYTPPCTFCHATAQGGGPVSTKFGDAMVLQGLTISVSTVGPALDALDADKWDSDSDGTPDIQQIEEGRDPSTGTSGPVQRYGCGARVITAPVSGISVVIGGALVAGIALWRRRRPQLARGGGSPKDRTKSS